MSAARRAMAPQRDQIAQVFYYGQMADGNHERQFAAPINATRPPLGKDREGGYSPRAPVLARLVWSGCTEIVPAVIVWASREHDRVLAEWSPTGMAKPTRQTWLRRSDVTLRLRY